MGLKLNLNIDLDITHMPLQVYGARERIFLRKTAGESLHHVMMKLLSYVLFYHHALLIEAYADQHHKPDLVRFNERGEPVQWVDCGQTSLQKLERISTRNRLTFIDIVKLTRGELSSYEQQARTRLSRPERVRYWAFEPGFVDALCELIQRRTQITATVSQDYGHIYLCISECEMIESEIFYMGEAPEHGAHESTREPYNESV